MADHTMMSPNPMGALPLQPLAMAVALLALAPGCKEKRRGRCPKYVQVRAVQPQPGDAVVAEVNGRPILASAIRQRAQRKGLTAREAVNELIDEELLVQEAERRGVHRSRAVVEAGKQAAVYQLLSETFEKEFSPSNVPDKDLRRIYNRGRKRWFNRPELRRFVHAYLTRPWAKRNRHWNLDADKDRDLKKIMQNFHRLVVEKRPKDWEAFRALAMSFDQGDQALSVGKSLQAHKDLRRPFAEALFALPKPGAFSEVIETKPWYHVAFLIEVMPRKDISYAQAREKIRAKVYPHARKEAFKAWVNKVKKQCSIRVQPENLPVGDHSPGATAKGRK